MIESVHIPIYCDSEENKAGALLTLKTIRVGFPNVRVCVYYEGTVKSIGLNVAEICGDNGFEFNFPYPENPQTNDRIIKELVYSDHPVRSQGRGFAVVDSDVVFFENCEDFETEGLIAGEFIPEFICPIAKAVTVSRLHTAFFVVPDPVKLRRAIELTYRPALPKFCPFDPFAPVVTFRGKPPEPYFYDSCAMLYHAIGGNKFDDGMLRRFEHLYAGSYAIGEHRDRINAAYQNSENARGTREIMTRYFEERKP